MTFAVRLTMEDSRTVSSDFSGMEMVALHVATPLVDSLSLIDAAEQ